MLKEPTAYQHELEMVTLESLVPRDHLVRKIDAAIDLTFIRAKVAHLYCADNGRPAIDPVLLFKLLLLGYLFGIRSERQLIREVQVNVAYRWFLGLRLTDKVPDASTISQNRRRRFADSEIYQEIFDEIVLQAIGRGMVEGKVLYTDSTHLKANANKNKYDLKDVAVKPAAYLEELDAAIDADRQAQGKRPLKPRQDKDDGSGPTKEIKVSRTDPESGYMVRDGKPKGFFYLDHRTVDGKHAIITDTHVTPANVHDSQPYLARLDRQSQRFNLNPYAVGLDAGYFTPMICQGLEDRSIAGVMGYRRPNHKDGYFYKREYIYDAASDTYTCPHHQQIAYKTTNRVGYREYHSDPDLCTSCPGRDRCTQSANRVKVIVRHVWEDAKARVDARRLTPAGKKIYARRKETVERSFADAKQLHGHRYARLRGLKKVMEQCLLAATAQNMKKIALLLAQLLTSFYAKTGPRRLRIGAQINALRSLLALTTKRPAMI
ncbi:IS1182 family transposase [Pusillimonas minor]|uniref:IS1182 family transposase n=1 Tax=Pusillimonas minor TaxID=2697024 RepID=UPI0020170D43|nr:IS1182 family transposase [Pusillimonas minor]